MCVFKKKATQEVVQEPVKKQLPIDDKLVVAISASALFDTAEDEKVFQEQGKGIYIQYEEQHAQNCFAQGVAFPFITKLLSLNDVFPDLQPVEVVLFTRNPLEVGKRLQYSIQQYNLNITKMYYSVGEYNFKYLPAFNASIFLSTNENHTKAAMEQNYAAGTIIATRNEDSASDDETELRLAFDFDGVIGDDTAEVYYQTKKDLKAYFDHEKQEASIPLHEGPLGKFIQKVSMIQNLEKEKQQEEEKAGRKYNRILKSYIVTARNAPADERVINTLKSFGVEVDGAFFMGGVKKNRVLNIMKPHMFFDDQKSNLEGLKDVVAVHIPYGIHNKIETFLQESEIPSTNTQNSDSSQLTETSSRRSRLRQMRQAAIPAGKPKMKQE